MMKRDGDATWPWKPPVSEKAFDEFHLYTIARPVTLRDQETKQVEFVRGTGVKAPKIYVYDGATMNYGAWNYFRGEGDYGIQTNKKVWVLREFKNSKDNNLGMALPKGRLRFYSARRRRLAPVHRLRGTPPA